MKIVVLTGSPHKKGTSKVLADEFTRGAEEIGHEVFRFNSDFEDVTPCKGCDYCKSHDNQCIKKDAMEDLNPKLLEADLIVFVSPLYYFGFTAQIKTVIDRFYAKNPLLIEQTKKTILLATSADNKDWTMNALVDNYKNIIKYFDWEDQGIILAKGCGVKEMIDISDYPQKAYELGKSL